MVDLTLFFCQAIVFTTLTGAFLAMIVAAYSAIQKALQLRHFQSSEAADFAETLQLGEVLPTEEILHACTYLLSILR